MPTTVILEQQRKCPLAKNLWVLLFRFIQPPGEIMSAIPIFIFRRKDLDLIDPGKLSSVKIATTSLFLEVALHKRLVLQILLPQHCSPFTN
jgi:hypothetical protein